MHPMGYAQRSLPIALQLMPPEVKIPIGDTVKLACHLIPAELVNRALGLFCRSVFP